MVDDCVVLCYDVEYFVKDLITQGSTSNGIITLKYPTGLHLDTGVWLKREITFSITQLGDVRTRH